MQFIELFYQRDIPDGLKRAFTCIYIYVSEIFDVVDRDAVISKSRFNRTLRVTSRKNIASDYE